MTMQLKLRPVLTFLFTLLAIALAWTVLVADAAVTLTHVHGLSYSADGKRLFIPSHRGLAAYADGRWTKANGPLHDYMGFSATRNALYSSGHPAPDSGLTNPFGLIKSLDGGKTWRKLGLEGESDFHTLATSYETNAVYVLNHQPNSRMSEPGIYSTRNDGMSWQKAGGRGLRGKLIALAVHPRDPKIVAAGTSEGLYLSTDGAGNFQQLLGGAQVLALSFDLDGQHLWLGSHAGKTARLAKIALKPGATPESRPLPALADDAVAYVAQNPARRDEIAIATFKRSVFLSGDGGRSWKQIAKEGDGAG